MSSLMTRTISVVIKHIDSFDLRRIEYDNYFTMYRYNAIKYSINEVL